jgi:signal transduction histidine kinase
MTSTADSSNATPDVEAASAVPLAEQRRGADGAIGKTRGLFFTLALAAVIPLLIFASWVAYVTADQARIAARKNAEQTVRAVAARLQSEISQQLQAASMMTLSPTLDRGDLAGFYSLARRATEARPLWATVTLANPDGTQLLNVLRPLGEALTPFIDTASFSAVLRTKKPAVGGIGPEGAMSLKRLVTLRVPVMRNDELRYVVSVGIDPEQISQVLREAGAPAGWNGFILDARGATIAQTSPENFVAGRPAEASVREAVSQSPSGTYRGVSETGESLETSYLTMDQLDGWSVHFTISSDELDGPVLRSLLRLVLVGLLSLLLAVALGWLIAREIAHRARIDAARSTLVIETLREKAEMQRTDLLHRLAQAQEAEQLRIARELHDQVGQTVTGLSLGLKRVELDLDGGANAETIRERLAWLRKLSGDIGRDIHRAAADLRPTEVDDLGLSEALKSYIADWSRRYGIDAEIHQAATFTRLSPDAEVAVYRTIREALNNVLKHADAKKVIVSLDHSTGMFKATIEDDGRGFDPKQARNKDATPLGLSVIRERLAIIRGSLELSSAPGGGTRLSIAVPLTAPQ